MPSGNLNVLPIPDEVITNVNNLLQQIEAALQPYIPLSVGETPTEI